MRLLILPRLPARLLARALAAGHGIMFVGKVEEDTARPLVTRFAREPAAAVGILFVRSGGHRSNVKS
jgi:hypothetical protein